MQVLLEVGKYFFTAYALAFVVPIFWIVLFLVFLQYRRQVATEEKLFGRRINGIGRQMLLSLGPGAVGGFFASAVLVLLGLSLEQVGLYFIWPVALLLLLINPRFLCFAYAGGIVAGMVLLARYLLVPAVPVIAENPVVESLLRIHIPALLVLIGLLHLVEAFLIYLSGHWGSSPIYLKRESGEVVGAFSLQRFWPLPLVALLVAVVAAGDIAGVDMPGWWPILQSTLQPGEGQTLQYMVIPVAAGLGYADMALSSSPRRRSTFSARSLALYSSVLLAVAVGAEYVPWLALPGVVLAPVGHELLIYYGKRVEESGEPRFRLPQKGVLLMMVLPGTAAAEAGLVEEDIILRVNGDEVDGNSCLVRKIENSYFLVLLEVERDGGRFTTVLKKSYAREETGRGSFQAELRARTQHPLLHRSAAIGFIPAPAPDSPFYLEVKKTDPRARLRKVKSWFAQLTGR